MPFLIVAILVVLVLAAAMYAVLGLVSLLATLFIAGLIGWAADAVVPGRLPYGFVGAILAGIVGGFIGSLLLGGFGPALFGVRLIPAFAGAVLVAVAAEILTHSRTRQIGRR